MVAYYTMGKKSWYQEGTQVLEREALWQVMKGLSIAYKSALDLDYGELSDMVSEQYWYNQPGHEVRHASLGGEARN